MIGLALTVLGQFTAKLHGKPLPSLPTVRAQGLLAYLSVEGILGLAVQRRETLMELLWPGMPPNSSRKNLRTTIYYLRKSIGYYLPNGTEEQKTIPFLLTDRQIVQINPAYPITLDLAQFLQLLGGPTSGWPEALDLYKGDFLFGFSIPDNNPFEEWVRARRVTFQHRALESLEVLTTQTMKQSDYGLAEHYARRQLELEVLHEPAWRQLMEVLTLTGRRSEALAEFEMFVELLWNELGVEPSSETLKLREDILVGNLPVVDTVSLPPPSIQVEPRHNLPTQPTPFIGRDSELVEIKHLINTSTSRLLTLVGPGGIGKTRLALEAASAVLDNYQHGVFFVPLSPLESTDDIVSSVADNIDLQFFGGIEPRQQLIDNLSRKQMLLILDNFEHLLEGTVLVAEIQRSAPSVTILVTSRERLQLSGETVFRLSGLNFPENHGQVSTQDNNVAEYGAMKLLLYHARLTRPSLKPEELDLQEMAHICYLVRGIPLAIVLAASWLEILSFKELADEISESLDILASQNRDIPERQRSIRATFDHSWRHLSAVDQDAFMKLSVFRGGFTRQAVQKVTGAGLQSLRTLVDKSLIAIVRPDRYEVHELLRQFASEKLMESGAAEETRDSHSVYYLKAVHEREAHLKGSRQLQALNEIEADLANVAVGWGWALQRQELSRIDQVLEGLYLSYDMRSRFQEGAGFIQLARERLSTDATEQLTGRILARHAWLRSRYSINKTDIGQDLEKSLAIAQAHSNLSEIALATFTLGSYYSRVRSDFVSGLHYFERSLEIYRELNDPFYTARVLGRIGYCYMNTSEWKRGIDRAHQGMVMARDTGDKVEVAWALINLSTGAVWHGDYHQAEDYLRESLEMANETGSRVAKGQSLAELGLVRFMGGHMDQAYALAEEGLAIARDIGYELTAGYALATLGLHKVVTASVEDDYFQALQLGKESKAITTNAFGQMIGDWALANAYCGLGQFKLALHHTRQTLKRSISVGALAPCTWLLPAFVLIQINDGLEKRAIELLSLAMNHPLSPKDWAQQWELLSEARVRLKEKLGQEFYKTSWHRGQKLDLGAVIIELLVEFSE